MIAVVDIKDQRWPCVVSWVGRKGLKLRIVTYCGKAVDAGQGVRQVSDVYPVCEACNEVIERGELKQ